MSHECDYACNHDPIRPAPAAQVAQSEREQFEQWARSRFLMPDEELRQIEDGYYSVTRLSSAWRAWQDRAELCKQIKAKALDARYSEGYANGWGEGRAALARPVAQSEPILTWQERRNASDGSCGDAYYMRAEIADLRAALASRAPASGAPGLQQTNSQRAIADDAEAFEATLHCKPARAESTAYPCGWKYTSEATQRAFQKFCAAAAGTPAIPPQGDAVSTLTDEQISRGARCMADRSAALCNVDKDDNWKIYGQDFIDEFRAGLEAAK